MKDKDAAELKRRMESVQASIEAIRQMTILVEKRVTLLEDLFEEAGEVKDTEDENCPECGKDHSELIGELMGQIANIEFNKKTKKGPWFFIVSGNKSNLLLQEMTGPASREKIGDPEWHSLNEINKITVEREF